MLLSLSARHTGVLTTLIVVLALLSNLSYSEPVKSTPLKILYIMSYHSPWRWTDDQLQGFKDGLAIKNVEYKVFQMDTKNNSTLASKKEKAKEAKALIEKWQPDLVYTTDDDAQQYITQEHINSATPFVFSGVNKKPAFYGLEGSTNVTGVLEHEHFTESVNLVRAIKPEVKKLAVVFDDAAMWAPVQKRIKEELSHLPEIELVAWDVITSYTDYKKKINQYQSTADALALVGIFNFKDSTGSNVPYHQVLRWTTENSALPDFSFWADRVHFGTLAAVSVSGYEQGLAAGQMAKSILVDGIKPSDIPFKATAKGLPIINLARANMLGIKIRSSILLSSQVIQDFEWNK
ncbi:ABC-type uncharacterized transport system, substrate-binding protein [Alteromonadaceae bacterium Bs31]|nr:ABC-type uncharacterized transport system, substrate-binding protein [Alteromonadaceae bacterium Bs31]